MAIAHNISSTQYVATGTTNTITIAPTATATGLIAYVMLPNAKSVTSVTWKGTPLTLLTSQVCGPFTLYAYTLASPSTGSGNLVLTVGSSSESYFSASFYNDTDTTTVVDTFAKQSNASGTTLTQTVTTSADNEWTSCVALADMGGLSASTGSTVRGSILNTAFGVFDSNGPITPAGSTSMLQTVNNGNNGGIIIALKPSNLIIPDTATATFAVVDPTVTTAQNVTRARYWVGGTGTWSSTNTANWSATSGGAGGQSVPVAGDSIYFDHNSGGGTVTFNYSPQYKDFSAWGFTGTITSTGTVMPVCSGNFEPGYTATFGSNGSQSMLFTGGSSTRDVRLSSFAQYASGGLNFDPNVIFRNLDITFGTASSGNYSASLNGAMSIYGLFRIDGSMHTTTGLRVRAVSSGTTQTITMQPGSSFELNKCTFRDINVVGATLSGTQVAVINNTTNVTPSSPTTYYWIGGTGNYNDASKWSLSSGGPSASAYPHTGDRMVFDANSFTSDNQTFTYNTAFGPEVDLRNVTRPVNLTFNTVGGQSPTICGSLRLRSNVTVNGNSTFFFTAPNDIYIDWNGATYTGTATAVMTLQSVGIGNHLASNLVLPSTSTVSISSVSALIRSGITSSPAFLPAQVVSSAPTTSPGARYISPETTAQSETSARRQTSPSSRVYIRFTAIIQGLQVRAPSHSGHRSTHTQEYQTCRLRQVQIPSQQVRLDTVILT
jgi:hypothetical protein